MILEDAIQELLRNDPTIAGITGDRIYPGVAPETNKDDDMYPLVLFRPPTGTNRQHIETLDGGIRLFQEWIQIFSATRGFGTYLQAALLDDAVFELLHEFSGTVTGTAFSPAEQLQIQRAVISDKAHVYVGYHDQTNTHHFMTEFLIHYLKP